MKGVPAPLGLFLLASLCGGGAAVAPAGAVMPGQIDTFEDGTTQGWIVSLQGSSHSLEPEYPPDPVVAQLGVNNIEAPAEPTPTGSASWGRIKCTFR